jgi:hypothetical protein
MIRELGRILITYLLAHSILICKLKVVSGAVSGPSTVSRLCHHSPGIFSVLGLQCNADGNVDISYRLMTDVQPSLLRCIHVDFAVYFKMN